MSIQVQIESEVKKYVYSGVEWFSEEKLVGGVNGVDLCFQVSEPTNKHILLENERIGSK